MASVLACEDNTSALLVIRYLHCHISYSQCLQYTHKKLEEENEEKNKKVEGTITPENKKKNIMH